ncbi:MAG: hypothetical protein M3003_11580 [Candidatus Dormibacteraeota bacterium]|nr:hypothetical protein [Candidatus Dormibacteraeota bacterium]
MISILRRAVFGLPAAGVAILALNAAASAGFDPYVTGSIGYDYSYPQCGATAPTAAFGIVGVNAGYPFTYYNSCLSAEFAAAQHTGNAAVYINTGYDPTYTAIDGRHTTLACANSSQTIAGTKAQQAAWAVGCSEAQRDGAYASSQSVAAPTAWWLDVEIANSWSSSDLSLNRYTIQGIVATLRVATAVPIGIYSTGNQWKVITGGYQALVDANWVATGQSTLRRAKKYCGSTGFTGAKVWLVQYVAPYDHDYVC